MLRSDSENSNFLNVPSCHNLLKVGIELNQSPASIVVIASDDVILFLDIVDFTLQIEIDKDCFHIRYTTEPLSALKTNHKH